MQKHPPLFGLLAATCCAVALPASMCAAQVEEGFDEMPSALDRRPGSDPWPSHAEDNVASTDDDNSEHRVSDPNAMHPLDLVVIVAAGSPVGALGAELSLNMNRWLALRVGAGVGSGGEQLSVLIALRLPLPRRTSIGIATGVSLGGYETWVDSGGLGINTVTTEPSYRWKRLPWWNTELFFEARGEVVIVRPFVGVGIPLTQPSPSSCDPGDLTCEPDKARVPPLLLLGVGLGWG